MFDRVHTEPAEQTAPACKYPKMTMTVNEMAKELNISRPTAYNLVK